MTTQLSNGKILREASKATRRLSDDVLQHAEQAAEATRDFADEAIDKAGAQVRELRDEFDPAVDLLATKARKLARRGLAAASDTGAQAQRALARCADATGKYVAEQPVKSVLIAAAAGAAIAALLMASRPRGRGY